MVISRYREKISWVQEIPEEIEILIYNKGEWLEKDNRFAVKNLQNIGRESHTYLTHIVENYESIDDVTIFCQGDPFCHNHYFFEACQSIVENGFLNAILPLTYQYHHGMPPFEIIQNYRKKFYIETINRKDLNPFKFFDQGIVSIVTAYKRLHGLNSEDDIINHFSKLIDLPDAENQHFHKFFYSACFAVKKEAIVAHDKSFYEKCLEVLSKNFDTHGYIFERMWYKIFNNKKTCEPKLF